MARGMTLAYLAALAADAQTVCHLLEVELDSGTVRMTDSYRNVLWNAVSYQALGHLLGFDSIEETAQLQVNDTIVQLSAVDQTMLAAFLLEQYVNRPARIYLALLDSAYAPITDPILMIQGRLDEPALREDPDSDTSTLQVKIINQWSDYERTNGRKTNDAVQQFHFPGDTGFQHAYRGDEPIIWGRAD